MLSIPIDDSGALLMKPSLSGTLRQCKSGGATVVLDRQLDTFVPRTRIDYPWYLEGQVLPAGCYRITLRLQRWRGGPILAAYTGKLRVGQHTVDVQQGGTKDFGGEPEAASLAAGRRRRRGAADAARGRDAAAWAARAAPAARTALRGRGETFALAVGQRQCP